MHVAPAVRFKLPWDGYGKPGTGVVSWAGAAAGAVVRTAEGLGARIGEGIGQPTVPVPLVGPVHYTVTVWSLFLIHSVFSYTFAYIPAYWVHRYFRYFLALAFDNDASRDGEELGYQFLGVLIALLILGPAYLVLLAFFRGIIYGEQSELSAEVETLAKAPTKAVQWLGDGTPSGMVNRAVDAAASPLLEVGAGTTKAVRALAREGVRARIGAATAGSNWAFVKLLSKETAFLMVEFTVGFWVASAGVFHLAHALIEDPGQPAVVAAAPFVYDKPETNVGVLFVIMGMLLVLYMRRKIWTPSKWRKADGNSPSRWAKFAYHVGWYVYAFVWGWWFSFDAVFQMVAWFDQSDGFVPLASLKCWTHLLAAFLISLVAGVPLAFIEAFDRQWMKTQSTYNVFALAVKTWLRLGYFTCTFINAFMWGIWATFGMAPWFMREFGQTYPTYATDFYPYDKTWLLLVATLILFLMVAVASRVHVWLYEAWFGNAATELPVSSHANSFDPPVLFGVDKKEWFRLYGIQYYPLVWAISLLWAQFAAVDGVLLWQRVFGRTTTGYAVPQFGMRIGVNILVTLMLLFGQMGSIMLSTALYGEVRTSDNGDGLKAGKKSGSRRQVAPGGEGMT